MNSKAICLVMLGASLGTSPLFAETPLQKTLNDLDVDPAWIYHDFPAGLAEAKKSGKPLMVVFR